MQQFDFRGLPIAYERRGRGEPIVFLHNGGTSHAIWGPVADRLSTHYETFALDLLGYGASAKPGGGYTLDTHAAILSDFIDAHRLDPAAVVGNCMGSAIALRFAIQRGSAVRALVLLNPLTEATFLRGGLGLTLRFRRAVPRLAQLVWRYVERLRLPRWVALRVLSFQLGREHEPLGRDLTDALCACYADDGQMKSLLAVLDDMRSYAELDEFAPGGAFPRVCTIWGLENRVLSANAGRQLNQTLHPVRAEWMPGCGHLPMLERPEIVASTIQSFLGEVPT